MTRLYALLFFLLLSAGATAQHFPVDTLMKNGPVSQRINLVFVSDGYQAAELPRFITDVNNIVNGLFAQTPFREYRNYFNVFAVRVPSAQSGAGHPRSANDCTTMPQQTVNNYFGSSYDAGGIHRLLVPSRQGTLSTVLAASFPEFDQAFMVVNSPEYGGAGGSLVATSSVHPSANEISIHEIGHSFAQLADEYWAGAQYATERHNMTRQTSPTLVRWANWMNTNGVGIYPHTTDPSWKKPHQNCKMQALGAAFCSVCREAFVERIHALVRPLQAFTPSYATINSPTQDLNFGLTLLAPSPNTLRVTWRLNGTLVARNTSQHFLPLSSLPPGSHNLQLEVADTSALSRSNSHATQHIYGVTWTINRGVASTKVSAAEYEYRVETFPNPISEVFNLGYTLKAPTAVTAQVLDANGRVVKQLVQARQAAGEYRFRLTPAELGMRRAGKYLLVLDLGGARVTRQLVKE